MAIVDALSLPFPFVCPSLHISPFLPPQIKATHPCLGATTAKRNTSIGQLMNEVNIMREQLRHPNVVHYHKCFQEGGQRETKIMHVHMYSKQELSSPNKGKWLEKLVC